MLPANVMLVTAMVVLLAAGSYGCFGGRRDRLRLAATAAEDDAEYYKLCEGCCTGGEFGPDGCPEGHSCIKRNDHTVKTFPFCTGIPLERLNLNKPIDP